MVGIQREYIFYNKVQSSLQTHCLTGNMKSDILHLKQVWLPKVAGSWSPCQQSNTCRNSQISKRTIFLQSNTCWHLHNRFSDSQVWQRVSDQGESRSVKGWRRHQLCACLPSCLAVISPDVTRANRGALRPSSIRKSVKKKKSWQHNGGESTGSPNKSRCWFIYRQRVVRLWHPLDVGRKIQRIRDGHPECFCAGCPVWYNSPLYSDQNGVDVPLGSWLSDSFSSSVDGDDTAPPPPPRHPPVLLPNAVQCSFLRTDCKTKWYCTATTLVELNKKT